MSPHSRMTGYHFIYLNMNFILVEQEPTQYDKHIKKGFFFLVLHFPALSNSLTILSFYYEKFLGLIAKVK